MTFASLEEFLARGMTALAAGPVAMIFVEDRAEVQSTLDHHCGLGFASVLMLAPAGFGIKAGTAENVHLITHEVLQEAAVQDAINRIITAAPGLWLYYCYNSEYLFYPFMEHRSVGEMLRFHAEERRNAMLAYVVDLYAADLARHPNAVSLDKAHLDKAGYYALARKDPDNHGHPRDRQLDFFGGIRWRFEEHVPEEKRKIDRIALFRAAPGLELRADHTFNIEEYNTYACPWHHNLTAAVCSFRTAKALEGGHASTRSAQAGLH